MIDGDHCAASDVERVASEIRRYLLRSPDAADTVEGILRWWLVRIRQEEARQVVEAALASLVAQGDIVRRVSADGQVHYARADGGH